MARDSDRYYDQLAKRDHFRHCHKTVDIIVCCAVDGGTQAFVYQGGYIWPPIISIA